MTPRGPLPFELWLWGWHPRVLPKTWEALLSDAEGALETWRGRGAGEAPGRTEIHLLPLSKCAPGAPFWSVSPSSLPEQSLS